MSSITRLAGEAQVLRDIDRLNRRLNFGYFRCRGSIRSRDRPGEPALERPELIHDYLAMSLDTRRRVPCVSFIGDDRAGYGYIPPASRRQRYL
jgi:hypothetical protein